MIKLTELLSEIDLKPNKWTYIPRSEISKFKEDIFDLINTAYSPIGGHPNYNSSSDVGKKAADYKLIDINGDAEPDAVLVSKKKPSGHKSVGIGHDGTSVAKRKVIGAEIELLKVKGHYVEASGKIADIFHSAGVTIVTDEDVVRSVLKGKTIKWNGDGTYDRKIGGSVHTKVLMGRPIA